MSNAEKPGLDTNPPSPDDRCARCQHRRGLHRDDRNGLGVKCHYLAPHGGVDHACGGAASAGSYRGPTCTEFVEQQT